MAGKKGMHDKHRFSEEYLNRLRGKIEAEKLLKALSEHALTGKEMSSSQVRAAEVLLRKVLPELNATEITEKSEGFLDVMRRLSLERQLVEDRAEVQRSNEVTKH